MPRARGRRTEVQRTEFGLFDIVQAAEDSTTFACVESHLAIAREGDRLGLEYAFFAERHFTPFFRSATLGLLIASLAATTNHIRLGMLAYTLPLRHPVLLAEEVNMLDHLSGGRLEVGMGLGHRPEEIDALGLPSEHRRALFLESFRMMPKLWRGETMNHDGPAAAFCADRLPGQRSRLAIMRNIYVAASDHEAREDVVTDLMSVGARLIASPRGIDTSGIEAPTRATAERQHAEHGARQTIVSGGPERVAAAVSASLSTLHADVFLANLHLAGVNETRVRRSLHLFATEVIPRVTHLLGSHVRG